SVMVTEAPSIDAAIFTGPGLEGAELCETDTTNCATTDAAGLASIMLPADQEVSYTVSKDGYGPYLLGDVTDEPLPTTNWPLISDALLEADAMKVIVPYPWSPDGTLSLAAFSLRAGVTYELLDETATPFYTDEQQETTVGLTATTSTGRGGFFEVTPGEHQIEFGGTATNCTARIAWPGDAANRIRVPVRAGHLSFGSMDCDEP
ncbi:MAG: hypothetical protein KJN97_13350, partial [Deltaproteobacteria bacterium]|nr:hypothetical protein [Deltaproteobacteria bacterium]